MDEECICLRVHASNYVFAWDDCCPVHGVGTQYFRDLERLPFGYALERRTTREQWLEKRKA